MPTLAPGGVYGGMLAAQQAEADIARDQAATQGLEGLGAALRADPSFLGMPGGYPTGGMPPGYPSMPQPTGYQGPAAQPVSVDTPFGNINVDPAAAQDFAGFLQTVKGAGAPLGTIGSYNPRTIAGTSVPSQHAYGRAIDVGDQQGRNQVSREFQQWYAQPQNRAIWDAALRRYNLYGGENFRAPDLGHVEWRGRGGGPTQPSMFPQMPGSGGFDMSQAARAIIAANPRISNQALGAAMGQMLPYVKEQAALRDRQMQFGIEMARAQQIAQTAEDNRLERRYEHLERMAEMERWHNLQAGLPGAGVGPGGPGATPRPPQPLTRTAAEDTQTRTDAPGPALEGGGFIDELGINRDQLRAYGTQWLEKGTFPPLGSARNMAALNYQKAMRNAISAEGLKIWKERAPNDPSISGNPEDVPAYRRRVAAAQVAIQRFTSGPQGNTIRSLNVAVDHLQTLQRLGEALKNRDNTLFNRIANDWAQRWGKPAPTNFNTAKQIVGDEVIKAVVGAGATGGERELALAINNASSLEQIYGSVRDVAIPLMAGQLAGLRQQFLTSTLLPVDVFNSMLFSETRGFIDARSLRKESSGAAGAIPEKKDTDIRKKPGESILEWKARTGQ